MPDLTDLTTVSGDALTEEQIKGVLAQIDLDVMNLVRDGKLSALRYGFGGNAGATTDRAANLKALLEARAVYEQLLKTMPVWEESVYDDAATAE